MGSSAHQLLRGKEADSAVTKMSNISRGNMQYEIQPGVMYLKDDIGVTATYSQSERAWVEILLTSNCRENPTEQRMVRSELDPDYGAPSLYYEDGAS